jgi:hypothetical protein
MPLVTALLEIAFDYRLTLTSLFLTTILCVLSRSSWSCHSSPPQTNWLAGIPHRNISPLPSPTAALSILRHTNTLPLQLVISLNLGLQGCY